MNKLIISLTLLILLVSQLYPQKQSYMIGKNVSSIMRTFGEPYESTGTMFSYRKPAGTSGAEFVIFEFNGYGHCSSVETIWKYSNLSSAKVKYLSFKRELSKTHQTTNEDDYSVTFSKYQNGTLTTIVLAFEKVGRNWITRHTLSQ